MKSHMLVSINMARDNLTRLISLIHVLQTFKNSLLFLYMDEQN